MFKKVVESLFLLEFLELANEPEWESSSFAQPKPKSNQELLIGDFRNINEKLKQKIYPMPKINEILFKLYFSV